MDLLKQLCREHKIDAAKVAELTAETERLTERLRGATAVQADKALSEVASTALIVRLAVTDKTRHRFAVAMLTEALTARPVVKAKPEKVEPKPEKVEPKTEADVKH